MHSRVHNMPFSGAFYAEIFLRLHRAIPEKTPMQSRTILGCILCRNLSPTSPSRSRANPDAIPNHFRVHSMPKSFSLKKKSLASPQGFSNINYRTALAEIRIVNYQLSIVNCQLSHLLLSRRAPSPSKSWSRRAGRSGRSLRSGRGPRRSGRGPRSPRAGRSGST